ncbi:MAG TPA: hypothetical protein VM451_01550 [Candidatus Limnocylindria bacterium]|nr:hypothetical protein [Candidatus Limnocylindria bacterium]
MLAAVVLTACSAAPSESPAAPGASTAPVGSSGAIGTGGPGGPGGPGIEAATTLLNAATLADPGSLDALEGIRFTQTGTAAAASVITAGASGDALWAATYVYASAAGSASDPAPLLAVAENAAASPSTRAMAGAGLLAAGRSEGFEPLVAALGSPAAMDGSEPRTTTWEFAASVLERYTAAGFPEPANGDEAERTALASQWTAWLATNASHLRFDPATQLWVAA